MKSRIPQYGRPKTDRQLKRHEAMEYRDKDEVMRRGKKRNAVRKSMKDVDTY